MAEAESAEAPEATSSLKTWVTAIGSITALIGAVTGLIHAFPASGKAEAATSPSTTTSSPPAPKTRTLMWVPADCTKGASAALAVDSCADPRTLDWLSLQMDELRRDHKLGFDALPAGFSLKASDTIGGTSYKLSVDDGAGQELFIVGVGYNFKKNNKDGGLHVSKNGRMIAEAWLGSDGRWYAKP